MTSDHQLNTDLGLTPVIFEGRELLYTPLITCYSYRQLTLSLVLELSTNIGLNL